MTTTSKIKKVMNYSIFTVEILIVFLCLSLTLDIVEEAKSLLPMLQNLLFWWGIGAVVLLGLELGRYRVRSYV